MSFFGLILLVSCSTVKVNVQQLAPADFQRFKTYDWADGPMTGSSYYDERVREAIRKNLRPRGYSYRKGTADFLIRFTGTEESVLKTGWAKKTGEFGSEIYADAYQRQQGVVTLEVLDPPSKTVLWKGTAEIPLILTGSPGERSQRIDQAVYHILKKFPPDRNRE